MTLTRQQIIDRLLEYHEEADPKSISQAEMLRAWLEGYADPCGCALCQLMQELQIEIIRNAPQAEATK